MRSLKHKDTLNALDWLVRLSHSDTFAFAAVSDPAKLAELMAMGLRARGVDAVSRCRSDYGAKQLDLTHAVVIWDQSQTTTEAMLFDIYGYCTWKIVKMPDVRSMLARIMLTPADESSKSRVEALIRGEE